MNLIKQVTNDIKQGLISEYFKYLLAFGVMIFLSLSFVMSVKNGVAVNRIDTSSMTITDIFMNFFKGMKPYDPNSNSQFDMPTAYILLNVLLAFIIGNYPMNDLLGFGKNVLVRSRDRASWWISKCIWNVISVIVFYSILFIIILITCAVFGKLSFEPTVSICSKITGIDITQKTTYVDIGMLLFTLYCIPIVTSLALSMFQMTMAFITSPIISYTFIIAILVGGAFYDNPFVPGNYFMLIRNEILLKGGYHTFAAIFEDCVIFIVSVLVGYIYFKKFDIIEKHDLL